MNRTYGGMPIIDYLNGINVAPTNHPNNPTQYFSLSLAFEMYFF